LPDVRQLDFDVFRPVERCAEVEVGDVKGAELGAFPGENAVDYELD
jgi:hypothetical protein